MRKSSAPAVSLRGARSVGGRSMWPATSTMLGGAERPGLGAPSMPGPDACGPWNPDCDGDVWAIEVAPAGSPVYVAGEFASIGGKSRRGLAAVDARARTATLWDPGVGGAVHAIALDARRKVVVSRRRVRFRRRHRPRQPRRRGHAHRVATSLGCPRRRHGRRCRPAGAPEPSSVGGEIESVGALRRDGLAALTADGSKITVWQPRSAASSGRSRPIAHTAACTSAGGSPVGESRTQRSLATLDVASGSLAAWGPTVNSGVWAIAPAGDAATVYLGGAFTTVDGKARRRLAALQAGDGTLLPWNVGASAVVRALSWNGDDLWVGGQFTSIGGEQRRGIAAVEIASAQTSGLGCRGERERRVARRYRGDRLRRRPVHRDRRPLAQASRRAGRCRRYGDTLGPRSRRCRAGTLARRLTGRSSSWRAISSGSGEDVATSRRSNSQPAM